MILPEGGETMRKVTKISEATAISNIKPKLRVAAYARVSTDSDAQLESLEAQITFYENYILSREDWHFAGLYYDEGITGTKKHKRTELMRMMKDCENGLIDYIITKSISRFSRNTTDCLEMVRKLQELKIPIYFEKENINTLSMESELFLSILSSMAENESVSISDNSKWSIQKRFENGTYKISYPPYGYIWNGEEMVIVPEQAIIVKRIFAELLSGKGTRAIAIGLNREQVPSKKGGNWSAGTINSIVKNEKYAGDVLFQKTFTDSSFTRRPNNGQQGQYYVADHHEAIISKDDFEAANLLLAKRRSEKGIVTGSDKYQKRYVLSGKVKCGDCGDTFKRRTHTCKDYKYIAWCCNTHIEDKDKCSMLYVRDDDLQLAFVAMINKLIFAHRLILRPLVENIKSSSKDENLQRIGEIHRLLLQNTEQRETLKKLMAQGYIDTVLFTKENNDLLTQADNFQKEIEQLEKNITGASSALTEITTLLRFTERSSMIATFDEELFEKYIDSIVIHSRHEVEFKLKCGLNLKERM